MIPYISNNVRTQAKELDKELDKRETLYKIYIGELNKVLGIMYLSLYILG